MAGHGVVVWLWLLHADGVDRVAPVFDSGCQDSEGARRPVRRFCDAAERVQAVDRVRASARYNEQSVQDTRAHAG